VSQNCRDKRDTTLRKRDALRHSLLKRARAPERKPASRPGPGRPLQIEAEARRQLLLDAAEAVFVEMGYSAASMDDIARQAGMSKKTLYRLFKDKEALFAAVVDARRAVLAAMIAEVDTAESQAADKVLRSWLGKVAGFALAPRQVALHRLVIGEAQRTPELARAFYHAGSNKICQGLTDWLAQQSAKGNLRIADPASAANMLFSMVCSEPQARVLMHGAAPPDRHVIEERVAGAVDLFLNGASSRAGRGSPGKATADASGHAPPTHEASAGETRPTKSAVALAKADARERRSHAYGNKKPETKRG
jgi:AcrR family transcriptional regulator